MHTADVVKVVETVSRAADPTAVKSLVERRVMVINEMCQLTQADVWIWVTGERNPELRGDAMVTSLIDGGWHSESERTALLGVIAHPDLAPLAMGPIYDAMVARQSITRLKSDLVADANWDLSPLREEFAATGFSDFILSCVPIGKSAHSGIGIYRREGRPRFGLRERRLVETLFEHVSWLHRSPGSVPASDHVIRLTPRERQVVMLLLGGDSRKQVASKLGLSEHTVIDYLKGVYRKFQVSSRGELLAKFIAGETDF